MESRVSDSQLDLFAGSGLPAAPHTTPSAKPRPIPPTELEDAALLAAIPTSGVTDGPALAAEAGRRRLAAAIPVLADYCRRFAGFGTQHPVREQIAALGALGAIGGADAANAVARIIASGWVQGPTLVGAVAIAARLRSRLPIDLVLLLLRHVDPAARADACRLARHGPDIVATLIDLLGDLHREVSIAAACALGRMGRPEATPLLKQALRQSPSLPVIEAVPPVADDECIVLLGRIARSSSDLNVAARDALDAIDHPVAARLAARLRED
jgi:HEAT repeats